MINDPVTVPVPIEAASRRISASRASSPAAAKFRGERDSLAERAGFEPAVSQRGELRRARM